MQLTLGDKWSTVPRLTIKSLWAGQMNVTRSRRRCSLTQFLNAPALWPDTVLMLFYVLRSAVQPSFLSTVVLLWALQSVQPGTSSHSEDLWSPHSRGQPFWMSRESLVQKQQYHTDIGSIHLETSHTVYCVIRSCLSESYANLKCLSICINMSVSQPVLNLVFRNLAGLFLNKTSWRSDAFYMACSFL